MLRSVCARNVGWIASRHHALVRQASSAVKFANESNATESDGYGNDYGAGPSRLPYQPSTSPLGRSNIHELFATVQPGSFSRIDQFEAALQTPLHALQQDEVETVVKLLLGRGRVALATQLLVKLLQAESGAARLPVTALDDLAKSLMSSIPDRQTTPKLSRQVDSLMLLVQLLRAAQIRRPKELLVATMQYSLAEKRPDKAAAIFVGMVEDWVTEGRVAEGADPASFHPGGGPPVALQKSQARHSAWWIGVRTWKLPGEVLSPHQRQDLWHPNNLSLGEKLRGFPFASATSPPSLVPAPTSRLLDPILNSLQIDPKTAAPAEFESSMRALAILANSIHNRTLPCLSVGPLIDKLQRTPYSPPVYPLDMPDIPEDQRWAYEATVHIHLALQSLMFSPPISSSSFAEAHAHEAVITGTASMGSLAHFYRMQPLGFKDCVSLVRYGFERLRLPSALRRLVNWTKTQYNLGGAKPSFWNAIFRGASEIKDNRLALTAENALFGHTALASQPTSGLVGTRRPAKSKDSRLSIPRMTTPPTPDQQSLIILITHLGKTSQWDRLEKLVYQLIPFLHVEQKSELVHLSPELYTVLMRGLHLAGKTGLAQRVYNLALQAEKQWTADLRDTKDPDAGPVSPPDTARLPIQFFTSMMSVWANEVSGSYPRRERPSEYAVGWRLPHGVAMGLPRHEAAGIMAGHVYRDARDRWEAAIQAHEARPRRRSTRQLRLDRSTFTSVIRPNADFFTAALSAHSWVLGLRVPEFTPREASMSALEHIVHDMDTFNVAVPPLVQRKLAGESGVPAMTKKDWKCSDTAGQREMLDKAGQEAVQSEDKTRAAAEEMLQAEEEGLWRHQGVHELESRWAKSLSDLPEAQVVSG